ncbi:MAG: hypothetical protein DSZ32_03125 [Gammaproteobacteria bacterium]|nr:MAG: hypothetical protein DSZ32_03125 [Gammaproteobacteria bacterium]
MGHHQNIPMRNKKRRKPAIRYLVFGLFAVAIVLAAKSEIPAFSNWLDAQLQPEIANAKKSCQELAIAAASNPGQAKILLPGTASKTANDILVEGVLVSDGSTEFAYSCFASGDGAILRHGRAD